MMKKVLAILLAIAVAFIVSLIAFTPHPARAAINTFCVVYQNPSYACVIGSATPTPGPTATPALHCALPFTAPGGYPDYCWTPWAATSVWNKTIAQAPSSPDPNSSAYNAYYATNNSFFTNTAFGLLNESNDYGHPIYFGQSSDPTYTLACTASYANCNSHAVTTWHLPSYALPAGGTDHHMVDIDESSTAYNELDLYGVSSISGGVIHAASATYQSVSTGDGLYGFETRSGFRETAGIIREQEIVEGQINHALFLTVPCTNNGVGSTPTSPQYGVYPSASIGTDTMCTGNAGPPYGARFILNMTDAQILALGAPIYKVPMFMALAHYGGYVADTNGIHGSVSLQAESEQMYRTSGYTNPKCPTNGAPCTPLTAYFNTLGNPGFNGSFYNIPLNEVNWAVYGVWLLPPA